MEEKSKKSPKRLEILTLQRISDHEAVDTPTVCYRFMNCIHHTTFSLCCEAKKFRGPTVGSGIAWAQHTPENQFRIQLIQLL